MEFVQLESIVYLFSVDGLKCNAICLIRAC